MLPLSLTLHNFLSYRENVPTLHLEEVHVACLCGANGNGKSALLDAITWAMWGKARGQRQEQLLHQGQEEMRVKLEFEARGQRYQVTRRYARGPRQGTSSLELAVSTDDDYRPITADTMAGTQALLQQLISMDYDTFVNSAFLVQGRADLFTMATPAQRKEVLAKVLGLGVYERLEERAKARAREVQARLEVAVLAVERLEERTGRRPELSAALEQTEAELAQVGEALRHLESRLGLLRTHAVNLERRQQELQELEVQARRLEARRTDTQAEVSQLEERLATWHETTQGATDTDAGYEALQAARKRLLALQATAQQLHALERELAPLEQRIAAARAALESDVKAQERHLSQELVPRADALPSLDQTLEETVSALARLEVPAAELSGLVERQHQLVLEAQRLKDETNRVGIMGKETRAKLDLLDHDHQEGVVCPLCGAELGAEGRAHLHESYRREIDAYGQQYREQDAQTKELDQEAARLQGETSRRQQELDGARQDLEGRRAQFQARRDEALRAQRQVEEARVLLAEGAKALQEGRYAQEEQAQAAELRARTAPIAFAPEDLAGAEGQVSALEPWEASHRRLEEARARMPEDEEALARAQGRLAGSTEELERIAGSLAQANREVAELPGYQAQLSQVEMEHREAARRRDMHQEHRGSLLTQLEEVQRAEAELHDRHREQRTLAHEVGVYTELAQAFGKGGVQALLIEAAIPQLEEEANRLLGRMSDGRMSLKMETQRSRRTRAARQGTEPIETLDILIADELGTRSYEMFSGGESFQVDFALRVALSKLLAWRAGAPLPTLFIDEGFGTQDAQGRDRILDVIKSIELDFQRILVITHMDEIKEAFPVRIEVSRTPGAGSTFTVT